MVDDAVYDNDDTKSHVADFFPTLKKSLDKCILFLIGKHHQQGKSHIQCRKVEVLKTGIIGGTP